MKVLILDSMLEQTRNDADVLHRVENRLHDMEKYAIEDNSVFTFLLKHNGKKMQKAKEIWKFRLSKGERILYTYGRNVAGIREDDSGCIVLLAYSKHDDQVTIANSMDLQTEHSSISMDEYLQDSFGISDIPTEEEVQIIEDIEFPFDRQSQHHRILVMPDDFLQTIDETELDIYLSDEQYNCIESFRNAQHPMLILGGAGTGKSMIALHIMVDYADSIPEKSSQKIAYFTQSAHLRRNSEKRYKNIAHIENDNHVLFQDIDTFCMDYLEYTVERRKQLVNQFRFIREFPSFFQLRADSKLINAVEGIDWITVWTEIRGVIKGQLSREWRRCAPCSQNNFERSAVSALEKNGWIKRSDEDKRSIVLADSVENTYARLNKEKPKYGYSELNMLLTYFSSVDPELIDIGEKCYVTELTGEDSTIPEDTEQRQIYWSIYEIYKQFLKEKKLFDGNDLVRDVLKKGIYPLYEFVTVDEVQDYTELQIFLSHILSKNESSILFVGDGNQNVNPTLFRPDHLKQLFRGKQQELEVVSLHKNYRSPNTVVSITNRLADIRSKVIAKQHEEQELDETTLRIGTQPYRLLYNDELLKKVLLTLSSFPSTAFLVPDLSTKENIENLAKTIPGIGDTPFIYTVSEIKGMEFQYVICYNLISKYREIWDSMLNRTRKSYQTGERFYFNLLYVAMTRSQKHLGFIDEELSSKLEEDLSLTLLSEWDEDNLHFVDMEDTPAGWFIQAKQSEGEGRYEDAIKFYQRANADYTNICRCKASQAIDDSDYDEAFRQALFSGETQLIQLSAAEIESDSVLHPLSRIFSDTLEKNMTFVLNSISMLIESKQIALSESEKDAVRNTLLKRVDTIISKQISMLEDWILERM